MNLPKNKVQLRGLLFFQAQAIYNSVLKSKPSDIGLIAVASNNMLCLNKDQNIFDSKKRIKAATVEGLEHKLTAKHQAAIARNNTLLAMYTNQVDLCKSLGDALLKDGTHQRKTARYNIIWQESK